MQVLRAKQGHTQGLVGAFQLPAHGKPVRNAGKAPGEFFEIERESFQIPFHTHEEKIAFGILMLVGMEDIGLVSGQKIGHCRHDAPLVGTIDQQNGGSAGRDWGFGLAHGACGVKVGLFYRVYIAVLSLSAGPGNTGYFGKQTLSPKAKPCGTIRIGLITRPNCALAR